MEFGLPNCGMLIMKRGKVVKNEGRSMPDVRTMKNIGEGGYKCLESLDADGAKYEKMKGQIQKEYIRRAKKYTKVILAINSRAVPVVRYAAGILSWIKMQLEQLDQKADENVWGTTP